MHGCHDTGFHAFVHSQSTGSGLVLIDLLQIKTTNKLWVTVVKTQTLAHQIYDCMYPNTQTAIYCNWESAVLVPH